jgi:propionyl-CoA synthetase
MGAYAELHQRSLAAPEAFWAEQARSVYWHKPFDKVCDYSRPPFAKWFVGGQTNACHNAVDRHLPMRASQAALIHVSTETPDGSPVEQVFSYSELLRQVNQCAALMQALGVVRGDRVLVYMPMIPEAVFTMLACARIGAIHSVVFGGFASVSLAMRIDDARPRIVMSADGGSRGGKTVPYKPLLDEAIRLAEHKPEAVVIKNQGRADCRMMAGRDHDYDRLFAAQLGKQVPVVWLESTDTSYTLYTSGTTGKPKGVQRDVGGHIVALAWSMKNVFCGQPGETMFTAADVGWAVGHSYAVYGPLIHGMASIIYEGLPTRPDPGIWWSLVARHKVTSMFTAPTAIRVLKKSPTDFMTRHDLSSLKSLFLAGEPLDEPTAQWISGALGGPVIDNYWQTESGWPILAVARGVEPGMKTKFGSPGVAMPGYNVKILDEVSGQPVGAEVKGVVAIEGPLPPGCMPTVWGDDARFENTYWKSFAGRMAYNTFDWGIQDEDGYFFILGRTDDVINVAGHRLGTREIEESISSHANVAEVAVVGVADALKGQVAMGFVVVRDAGTIADAASRLRLEGDIMKLVDLQLGAVARPTRVHFVTALPKTRSGKMLRRALVAVCEGRDPGDLTTIEDPSALAQIRSLVGA